MRRMASTIIALAVLACGVATDPEPVPFDDEVKAAVAAALTPPPTASPVESGRLVDLYFIAGERLVALTRTVRDDPAAVVKALIDGPGATAVNLDLRTAIPPATRVRAVLVTDGTARVDLSADFTAVGGQEEIFAVAQIVVTLTTLPEVDGVIFAIDGADVAVPTGDGSVVDSPLTPRDYQALLVG
jgi:spore germination protein GerM